MHAHFPAMLLRRSFWFRCSYPILRCYMKDSMPWCHSNQLDPNFAGFVYSYIQWPVCTFSLIVFYQWNLLPFFLSCKRFGLVKLASRRVVSREVLVGTGIPGSGGGRETIHNTTLSPPEWLLHWMGSSESCFNVLLTVRGKVTKTVCMDHNI